MSLLVSPTLTHLRAALNGGSFGVLTFGGRLEVLFINDRLTTQLRLPATPIDEPSSVLKLLESSEVLDPAGVEQLHRCALAAVSTEVDQTAAVTVQFGAVRRSFSAQVCRLDDGAWMATLEEVTARRASEASAVEQAMMDPLTGLPNRQLLQRRVVTALQGKRPDVAVLLVDLDRFKAVNDTLGHPIGDGLLRLVSRRLRSVLRPNDTVARLGGDEFGLLVAPAPDQDSLAKLAKRIVDMLGRPYLVEGHLINVGASVGVALAPGDGRDDSGLMRAADLALYSAKSLGGGSFSFFMPEMDARALARRSLEIDLRKAMVLQQFELFYQPQIDLETDSVVGFEALLRWRHPERGLVPPNDFIPLAEEIGLIVPLGEWVLREACREAAHWPDAVSVAVNVSPHQFADTTRLVTMVARGLGASGLPGRRLEIEITESVLLRNEQAVLQTLHQLRAMGVRVAMDDFGTGYSSLSQLQSFPFDKIKIDRSFVKDRGDVDGQNAIIRAITALGVSLGMSTIAEGVETVDQLDRIRLEGCRSVQGYLFSRPVPAGEVDGLITAFAGRQLATHEAA